MQSQIRKPKALSLNHNVSAEEQETVIIYNSFPKNTSYIFQNLYLTYRSITLVYEILNEESQKVMNKKFIVLLPSKGLTDFMLCSRVNKGKSIQR